MKILLADDSPAMRTLFRGVLEKLGHASTDIVEAKDGREALAAFRNPLDSVDVIVFDWDLPGLDGLGLMGQLKNMGLNEKVSVLLSVNRQQRALLPQVTKQGLCESIDRPFTEEMFEKKFRSVSKAAKLKQAESSKKITPVAPKLQTESAMPFLLRLPSAMIDDILKVADARRYESGAILLRAGQVSDALQIVTQGEVEVLTGSAGAPLRTIKDGDPFGEFSFMMSEPSLNTVRAKGVVLTASLSRTRLSELLRKHPSLDKHLSTLMGRHKEVMTARATTIVQSDFKGTFDTMPFANVIQILNVGRKSGVLGIRDDELSGAIYLENGEAVHAWTDEVEGEEAFYTLSGWTKAKFAFNSMRREEKKSLKRPTLTLLMDAMRRLEENPPPASEDVGLDSLFPSQ
jgi:CRP-like cAMP-binding protein/DNA-binding NarL/FixJ family response regulator